MARTARTIAVDFSTPQELTAGRIERLTCPNGRPQAFLRDTKAPGLRVRGTPSGAKAFIFEANLHQAIGNVRSWSIEDPVARPTGCGYSLTAAPIRASCGASRKRLQQHAAALAQRPTTLERTVRLVCDPRAEGLPPLDAHMIDLEHEFAEPKHHCRAYDELLAAWRDALAAAGCEGESALVGTLFLAAGGGRRCILRVQAPLPVEDWIAQMRRVCAAAFQPGA